MCEQLNESLEQDLESHEVNNEPEEIRKPIFISMEIQTDLESTQIDA